MNSISSAFRLTPIYESPSNEEGDYHSIECLIQDNEISFEDAQEEWLQIIDHVTLVLEHSTLVISQRKFPLEICSKVSMKALLEILQDEEIGINSLDFSSVTFSNDAWQEFVDSFSKSKKTFRKIVLPSVTIDQITRITPSFLRNIDSLDLSKMPETQPSDDDKQKLIDHFKGLFSENFSGKIILDYWYLDTDFLVENKGAVLDCDLLPSDSLTFQDLLTRENLTNQEIDSIRISVRAAYHENSFSLSLNQTSSVYLVNSPQGVETFFKEASEFDFEELNLDGVIFNSQCWDILINHLKDSIQKNGYFASFKFSLVTTEQLLKFSMLPEEVFNKIMQMDLSRPEAQCIQPNDKEELTQILNKILPLMTSLDDLLLNNWKLKDHHLQFLSVIEFETLSSLYLRNNLIEGEGILVSGILPKISTLDLADNPVTKRCWSIIKGISSHLDIEIFGPKTRRIQGNDSKEFQKKQKIAFSSVQSFCQTFPPAPGISQENLDSFIAIRSKNSEIETYSYFAAMIEHLFHIQDVPRDGNCLFSAVSLGTGETHETLREKTVEHLLLNTEFAAYMEDDIVLEDYAIRIAQPKTWGGNVEIAALSQLLERPIIIYSQEYPHELKEGRLIPKDTNIYNAPDNFAPFQDERVIFLLRFGMHYFRLYPKKASSENNRGNS